MQTRKMGCACDDCHAKYPCNQCTTCRPESLCVTFVPDPPGTYDELHPPVCCTETVSTRLRLNLDRRVIIERPVTDPPTYRQFRDVTCETDAYFGSLTCDVASLSFSVTVESVGGSCVLKVSVTEYVAAESFSETTDFEFEMTASEFSWAQTIEFEGTYLPGEITLDAAPTGYMNTKFRGMCSPEELEAAPNDCAECKSCKHCRCLPKKMCIGYSVTGACGPTVLWKSATFDPDEQAYEATFTITNVDDTTEERTVRMDFCWHRTFDNYGETATSESLFNQCVFSLQVANSPHQFSQKIDLDWEVYGGNSDPPTLLAAGCIWDSGELSYTISDDEEFTVTVPARPGVYYVGDDPPQSPEALITIPESELEVTQQEVVYIRYGSCGCPSDSFPPHCEGSCPDISVASVDPSYGLCGPPAVYATVDAPDYAEDGESFPLFSGSNAPWNLSAGDGILGWAQDFGFLTDREDPVCLVYSGVVFITVCYIQNIPIDDDPNERVDVCASYQVPLMLSFLTRDWCASDESIENGEVARGYELRAMFLGPGYPNPLQLGPWPSPNNFIWPTIFSPPESADCDPLEIVFNLGSGFRVRNLAGTNGDVGVPFIVCTGADSLQACEAEDPQEAGEIRIRITL